MREIKRRKKRIKLEDVVDEALRLLPRGMYIPSFTGFVKEAIEENNKIITRRNNYEKDFIAVQGLERIQASPTSDATSDQ